VFLSACSINQIPTPAARTVTPTLTAAPVPVSSTPAPATLASRSAVDPVKQALLADWEELFRMTSRLEYVKANGRPSEKNWWIEQSKRFYAGKALTAQLQHIEQMFNSKPEGVAPGFIENASYAPQVESCSSDNECTVLIHVQGGKVWSYDLGHKKWIEGGSITEPFDWVFSMQYDPASGHWKVN
jgi:hypothetical protein